MEGGVEGREDKEKGVSSCWITLRTQNNTLNCKRKHQIALCGKLALEEATDLS